MSWIERLPAPPDTPAFIGFILASALAAGCVLAFDFVPIIDHVNLAFHEAGHLIFGLFGELMHWLGGTLAQFVFPIACAVHFLRRAQLLQAAGCVLWALENLRYVAFYLGDARTQALPLVGGGQHDWAYLLGRFGLLEQDQRIAGLLVFLCWSGWIAVCAGVTWWWWQGRRAEIEAAAERRRQAIIEAARERARESSRSEPPGAGPV
ncbi:hypothetical protein [Pseudomarimonas salicorniae]|uniref:Peptidase M50B-like n=1 Tax=Pseudomarimonas salicorniae TaxID=2933270 RepID=A0ABT0GEC6_9GAMM|nr:hypothetical protein [Lysobacter sp. CAU 1642]MCK7592377.1 hypothetical protein [Lysobacter sp. CAU 1642]